MKNIKNFSEGVAKKAKRKTKKSFFSRKADNASEILQEVSPVVNTVDEVGQPHPWHGRVEKALDNRCNIYDLQSDILSVAKDHITNFTTGPNEFDMDSLYHDPRMMEMFLRFREIRNEVLEVPEVPPHMESSPDHSHLYDRIYDTHNVQDLGCGEESKYGLEGYDPRYNGKTAMMLCNEVDEPNVVSMNCLTQLPVDEKEQIDDVDGCHIVPDMSVVSRMIGKTESGKVVVPSMLGKTWEDYDYRYVGYRLKSMYKATNTYRPRKLNISFSGPILDIKYLKFLDEVGEYDVDSVFIDYGPHLEGVKCWLICKASKAMLLFGNGQGYLGEMDSPLEMILQCTMIDSELLVLDRIKRYRNLKPFHSGDLLRLFNRKVKIKIKDGPFNGEVRLVGPPRFNEKGKYSINGKKVDCSGTRFRREDHDFIRREKWEVFVKSSADTVKQLDALGWYAEFDKPCEELSEYQATMLSNGHLKLKYLRSSNQLHAKTEIDDFIKIIKL